jgi:hypothetical protein
MTHFLCAVSLVVMIACSDPVSDPGSGPVSDPAPDPSYVWANPPGCDSNAPAVSLPAAQGDSMPAVRSTGFLTIDETNYNLAQHVPGGWANYYLTPVNGRNTPVLMFVDTTNVLAAIDSLVKYYPYGHRSFARDSIVLRVVRWNWVQLYDWYRYISYFKGLPDGWTFSDVDEFENRLSFGGNTAADRDAVVQSLRQLDVPCWLAAVRIKGYAQLSNAQPPPAASGPGLLARGIEPTGVTHAR